MTCGSCGGPCLLKDVPPRRTYVATHQAILDLDLADLPVEIIGPDTLLAQWQYHHQRKDWPNADRVREVGAALGLTPVFAGDHYEVHAPRR